LTSIRLWAEVLVLELLILPTKVKEVSITEVEIVSQDKMVDTKIEVILTLEVIDTMMITLDPDGKTKAKVKVVTDSIEEDMETKEATEVEVVVVALVVVKEENILQETPYPMRFL